MKKTSFNIPFYNVRVTLIQIESEADAVIIKHNAEFRRIPREWQEDFLDKIRRGCCDGGDTWRNLEHRTVLVLFYKTTSGEKRAEVYSHEKRHIEDRVLEFFRVDDIESAGLLAGYLGVQFYKFERHD